MTLFGWLTFLHESLTVTLTVLFLWIYLFFLIMLFSQFPLTFIQTQRLFIILVLIGPVFMNIWDLLHGRISLNLRLFQGWNQLCILQHKYQVKPRSPTWLSPACAAATAYRNHFFHFYWQNTSCVKASYCCKSILEAAKLAYVKKTKRLSLPRNFAFRDFGELLLEFWTKVNLLYPLYLMTLRYCLLHLVKQNYLLKTFQKTLILMHQVSLYLPSFLELSTPE